MPPTEPTSTQAPQKAFPKPGDVILFKPDCNDLWNKAQVIGQAGKASGKHKDWVNIKDKNDQNISIDLSRVVWKTFTTGCAEEVNLVHVPKADQSNTQCLLAKQDELQKLKDFNTYEEVKDVGQFTISTTWVLWKTRTEI